jgi:hypothetical protein
MNVTALFRDLGLDASDQVALAQALQLGLKMFPGDKCWRLDQNGHIAFEGFNTSRKTTLIYRGVDARPLLLALSGRFQRDGEIAIRRQGCCSPYCLNPTHYFWGTKSQLMLEQQSSRKRGSLSVDLIQKLRVGRQEGKRILDLARQYKVPYHTARRICVGETYENLNETKEELPLDATWNLISEICAYIVNCYPEEAKEYNLVVQVSDHLECPWHRKGFPGHKGNFGLMGECLDCMEELKKGRCSVDVTNFDVNWYWQVKRFWEQVDIKGEDECWPWLGSTRKDGTESTAYFPSPFHSGKAHSASRVAFWLSRGYTGKYRVFARSECEKFCCNPKHLHIREIKDLSEPASMGEIKLNHGNIFQSYRENLSEKQPSPPNQLPSA